MQKVIEAELGLQEYTSVTTKLPKYLEKEFKDHVKKWIYDKKQSANK